MFEKKSMETVLMKRMGTWWHVLLRNATCEQSAWGRCCDTVRPGSPHLFLTYSVPAPQGCWGKRCDAGPNPASTCDGRGAASYAADSTTGIGNGRPAGHFLLVSEGWMTV